METAKHLDGPSREAIQQKAKKLYDACIDLQHLYMCEASWRYVNRIQVSWENNSPLSLSNPKTVVIRPSNWLVHDGDDTMSILDLCISYTNSSNFSHLSSFVVEIEDTAPFVEIKDSPVCSEVYNAVSKVKGMVMDIANDLHTLRTDTIPICQSKFEMQ
jgi:hypothetical protein